MVARHRERFHNSATAPWREHRSTTQIEGLDWFFDSPRVIRTAFLSGFDLVSGPVSRSIRYTRFNCYRKGVHFVQVA
jgi:hypothetical protein